MKSGLLNQRVLIQKPVSTKNAYGQAIKVWEDETSVFARIHTAGSGRNFQSDKHYSVDSTEITLRYFGDIKPTWRVVWKNYVYEVKGILHKDRRKVETKVLCDRLYLPVLVMDEFGISFNGIPITIGGENV